jgi:hypothetical protein
VSSSATRPKRLAGVHCSAQALGPTKQAPAACRFSQTQAMSEPFTPEAFAQRQLDAYNARDLEAFVREYTEDVVVYRLPGTEPVLAGKAAFAGHYRANRFNLPKLHAELVNRMVFGNKVIDQERVTGIQESPMEVAAIYEVTPSGISKVWFVS